MEIKDNFTIFGLFVEKKVKIIVDKTFFHVKVPTIRDFYTNDQINAMYHLWTSSADDIMKLTPVKCSGSFDFIQIILFQLGMYKEFTEYIKMIESSLPLFLPEAEIDYANKVIKVNDIIITEEIWDYIIYILKLSCGEKVEKPRIFTSEEERKFYLAQKEMDEKIKKIKAQKQIDVEATLKAFLSIQYAFNLSFDYLAEQTMAQIQWLQTYAAGAVSYEVNAQAFAAGNMKKGKKLDFFIK